MLISRCPPTLLQLSMPFGKAWGFGGIVGDLQVGGGMVSKEAVTVDVASEDVSLILPALLISLLLFPQYQAIHAMSSHKQLIL